MTEVADGSRGMVNPVGVDVGPQYLGIGYSGTVPPITGYDEPDCRLSFEHLRNIICLP